MPSVSQYNTLIISTSIQTSFYVKCSPCSHQDKFQLSYFIFCLCFVYKQSFVWIYCGSGCWKEKNNEQLLYLTIGPQLVVMFQEVTETLRGRTLLEKVNLASPHIQLILFCICDWGNKRAHLRVPAFMLATCCHASLPRWTLTFWNHKPK